MSDEMINQWLSNGFIRFFHDELPLISAQPKEECINHRLAVHLEQCKPSSAIEYSVDVEYDKRGELDKVMSHNGKQISIRPDIIIHSRQSVLGKNLVAIECKKHYLTAHDKAKLNYLMGNEYKYRVTIGVCYHPKKEYFDIYNPASTAGSTRICKSLCRSCDISILNAALHSPNINR